MILIESLLLSILLLTCIYVTYTDFKTGLIPNKALLISGAAALILDVIYYSVFQRDLFTGFLLNFSVNFLLSVLLYAYSFWGAGDSKFIILAVLSIPARFYSDDIFNIPVLTVTVQTFAIAFLYLAAESVVLGIIRKDFFKFRIKITSKSLIDMLKSYFLSYVYILFFSFTVRSVLINFIESNSYIIPLCNFFVAFTILNFDFFKRKYVIGLAVLADVIMMLIFNKTLSSFIPPIWNLFIIAIVILFRSLAGKYNYKKIPVSDIKEGMVMSLETVVQFKTSRIKGLPKVTTEDFRSRISADEAESIKKWGASNSEANGVIIVRKLPFAIFISIGIITFLGLRMWMSC